MCVCVCVCVYACVTLNVCLCLCLCVCVCVASSEVQTGHTADVATVVESCRRNKVCLKGIITSPLFSDGGILTTLNMKIRYHCLYSIENNIMPFYKKKMCVF